MAPDIYVRRLGSCHSKLHCTTSTKPLDGAYLADFGIDISFRQSFTAKQVNLVKPRVFSNVLDASLCYGQIIIYTTRKILRLMESLT